MNKEKIKQEPCMRCPECGGKMKILWWIKVLDVLSGDENGVWYCDKCGFKTMR